MWPPKTESWRRDPRFGVLVIVSSTTAMVFLAMVVAVLVAPTFLRLDMLLSTAIHDIDIAWLDGFLRAVTWLGSGLVIGPATAAVGLWLFVRRRRAEAVLLVVTVAFGVFAGEVVKLVVARARPALEWARVPLPETFSFPSTHALASALFFGAIAFLVLTEAGSIRSRRLVAIASTVVVLLVGMSRVYLGVHYFVDVLGGWFLAASVLAVGFALYFGTIPSGRAESEG
jgi:undecaprenyl-diphosphatase